MNCEVDISFCLPVYNVRNFLNDCIQSIVKQEFQEITYEILCLDDCSNDGSYEFLLKESEKLSQLKIFRNAENKGVSYTRNQLTRMANGKYIWYVDPDDMLIGNIIKPFFDSATKLQADVFLGDYIRIEEFKTGNEEYCYNNEILKEKPLQTKKGLPTDQDGKTMCALWAGLFRKNFLLEKKLFFNEKMIAQEDTLFYYEFSLRTDSIYKVKTPCYLYRMRKGSVMHRCDNERQKKYYESMKELLFMYEYYLEKGEFIDLSDLQYRINKMRQNVALCLSIVKEKEYIDNEIKLLQNKVNIYKEAKTALKREGPKIIKICAFFLSAKQLFWMYHWITTKNK